MDNLPTRYLLNRTAIQKNIPFFHGAVYGFEGRAMTVIPGKSACLNCLYHGVIVPEEKTPVVGVAPAVIGCIQATEVIKYIVGMGELLTGRLLNYDGLRMKFTEFSIKKDPGCAICGKAPGR
jgi:adenylyltransferase/sulfurtransferase